MENKMGKDIIPPHGGYRSLKSYKNAEIIYDATVEFCELYVSRFSRTYVTYKKYIKHSPECAANTMICLIHQTNFLLDRQLKKLDLEFQEKGGFTENLYKTRKGNV